MNKEFKFYFIFSVSLFLFFLPKYSLAIDDFILTINDDPPARCNFSQPRAELDWEKATTTNYRVFRRELPNPYGVTPLYTTTNLTYIDNSIQSDKEYEYQIRTDGAYISNNVIATKRYCPPSINNINSSCSGGPKIYLDWSSVSGSLNFYRIWRYKKSESPASAISIWQGNANSYTDGYLLEGKITYNYFIEAVWLDGGSNTSQPREQEAKACKPIISFSTSCEMVSDPGGPKFNLSWNQLLGVTGYELYRNGVRIAEINSASTSYADALSESFSQGYGNPGNLLYDLKALFPSEPTNATTQLAIWRCPPFLEVEPNCSTTANFRLSWTKTMGTGFYDVWRLLPGPNTWLGQTQKATWTDPSPCGPECNGVTYRIITSEPLNSNDVTKNIDCLTTDPPSPAPTLLEINSFCQGLNPAIEVNWQQSGNLSYYQFKKNGPVYATISDNYYIDSGITSGQNYTYTVTAVGPGGSTAAPNSLAAQALICSAPASPGPVDLATSCATGEPVINISWRSVSNIYSYEIFKGTSPTNLESLISFDSNDPEFYSLTWSDEGPAINTVYYYKVRANRTPAGPYTDSSPISQILTSDCLPTRPSRPTYSNFCEGLNTGVTLYWESDGENTSYYEIYRNSTKLSFTIPYYEQTATDTTGLENITYQYTVVAVGPSGKRATSSARSVYTYYCHRPDSFTINNNPYIYCQNGNPWASNTWTWSNHAVNYYLNRYLYEGSLIVGTTTLKNLGNVASSVDRGLGNAIYFNGDDEVEFPYVPEFDNLTPNLTMEAWIKPDRIGFMNILTTTGTYYGHKGYNIYLRTYKDAMFRVTLGGQTNPIADPAFGNYATDTWYHYVATYNGSQLITYINGVLRTTSNVASTSLPLWPLIVNESHLNIGGEMSSSNIQGFTGIIDEVRIYNRALSYSEVRAHYLGYFTNETGLLGLWHFDEGQGNIAGDSSGNNNHGTITGPGWSWVSVGPQVSTAYSWQGIAYSYGPYPTFSSNITSRVTTPRCPPSKPVLTLTQDCSNGSSSIKLEWSFSMNVKEYEIWRSTGTDPAVLRYAFPASNDPLSLWYLDYNLKKNQSYTYFIRAQATGTTGVYTDSASVTLTAPSCLAPDPPGNVNANSSCVNSYPRVTLSWDASPGANSYEVYKNGDFLEATDSLSITEDYPNVQVMRKYSYEVVAVNAGGSSDPSGQEEIIPGYCSASKAILSVSSYCSSTYPINEIDFKDPTFFNTKQYKILRSGVEIGSFSNTETAALNFTSNPSNLTDSINCGNDSSLDIDDKLTIELWINLEYTGTNFPFLSKGYYEDPAYSNNYEFETGDSGSKLAFRWGTLSDDNRILSSVNHGFNAGEWHHVAVTVDAENDVLTFYSDGSQLGASTTFNGILPINNSYLIIGDGFGAYFKGFMDEVRIYNRILSASEIEQHYQMNYEDESNLRALWHFNEAHGMFARDSSGNRNNCQIRPQLYWGAKWYNLSPSDPTYSVVDTKFSYEYKTLKDSNLQSNTEYSYLIETIDQFNSASTSQLKTVTTLNCGFAPAAPAITGTSSGCLAYKRPYTSTTWEGPSNSSYYYINRSTSSGPVSKFYNYVSPFLDKGSFALDFLGVSTGSVNVPDGNYIDGLSAISVEFWAYVDPGASYKRNVMRDDGLIFHFFNNEQFYLSGPYNGEPYVVGNSGYMGANRPLSVGEWYHFVGTWDRNQIGNNMKLYLNGELQSEKVFIGTNYLSLGSSPLIMNNGWQGYQQSIDGKFDEFRIYNRALGPEEVLQHYNGIYNTETGLLGLWHFEEGWGNTFYDISGNGNNGSFNLTEADWFNPDPSSPEFKDEIHNPSLIGRTEYDYNFSACGPGGNCNSSSWSVKTMACEPWIEDFAIEAACGASGTQINLSWEGEPGAQVDIRRSYGIPQNQEDLEEIATTYNNYYENWTDLEPGHDYGYQIELWSPWGPTGATSVLSFVETTTALYCGDIPSKPQITVNPDCVYVTEPAMYIDWESDPLGKTSYYEIFGTDTDCGSAAYPGDFLYIADRSLADPTDYPHVDEVFSVEENHPYCYYVKAVGNSGENSSDPKGGVSALCYNQPPQPPNPLTRVDWLSTADNNGVSVTLSWGDGLNEQYYVLERRECSPDNCLLPLTDWAEVATTESRIYPDYNPVPSNPIPAGYINDGRHYQWRAKSYNQFGSTSSLYSDFYIPIAIPGSFSITGQENGNSINVSLTEPNTTPASGRAYYTFYRSNQDEVISNPPDFDEWESSWATFSDDGQCTGTTSRECTDYSPSREYRYYMAVARAEHWQDHPCQTEYGRRNYTFSDIIDLFIFAPKWKEIPVY